MQCRKILWSQYVACWRNPTKQKKTMLNARIKTDSSNNQVRSFYIRAPIYYPLFILFLLTSLIFWWIIKDNCDICWEKIYPGWIFVSTFLKASVYFLMEDSSTLFFWTTFFLFKNKAYYRTFWVWGACVVLADCIPPTLVTSFTLHGWCLVNQEEPLKGLQKDKIIL